MSEPTVAEGKAAELRRQFDASFALPLTPSSPDSEDLLQLRVAGDALAIRLRDVSRLVSGRTIVPVPSAAPGLLGLAGIRGEIVPVFSLATLLGYPDDAEPASWLVLSAAPAPIALGFSVFEGLARIPKGGLRAADGGTRRYVTDFVSTAAGARAVIAVPLVIAALRSRRGPDGPPPQEQ